MRKFDPRTSLFLGLLLAIIPAMAQAARPCVENYSESGQWTTGKGFSTWIEYSATDESSGFTSLGRAIASEGFLGVSASKDLGVITAFQEDNGKKSPINATISKTGPDRVRVDLTFQLARGLRAPAAAVRDLLCKLIESAIPEDQRLASEAEADASGIALRTPSGDMNLVTTVGETRRAGFGPVLMFFSHFEPARAEVRTPDRRPDLVVRSDIDPSDSYLFIRFEFDKKSRTVKLGSAGSVLRMAFTGGGELPPDRDWTLPFQAEEASSGVWLITPRKDLEPGEYGLWEIKGYGAATFGID